MGSWIFWVHSNQTEGIEKFAKEKICQGDRWSVYVGAGEEAGAVEAEAEASVSGGKNSPGGKEHMCQGLEARDCVEQAHLSEHLSLQQPNKEKNHSLPPPSITQSLNKHLVSTSFVSRTDIVCSFVEFRVQ